MENRNNRNLFEEAVRRLPSHELQFKCKNEETAKTLPRICVFVEG